MNTSRSRSLIVLAAAAFVACDGTRAPERPPVAARERAAVQPASKPLIPQAGLELYKVPLGDSPGRGGSQPKVTVVVFSEFQCPFCSRVIPTVEQVLRTHGDDVRFVFKHRPLPFHERAKPAALAAEAAREQGRFWEMHDKLFANQSALGAAELEAYARALGLDVDRWKAALDSPAVKARVQADAALADQLVVQGTPIFFINGRRLVGAQPYERFKAIVDEEVAKAERLLAKGTPRAKLYEVLMKGARNPEAARGL